jgi:hypothetical protein
MKEIIRIALALALPALLAGCQLTMVETLPAGATPTCPAEWRGAWIAIDESGRDDGDFGIVVHDDCGVESRDHGNPHPAKPPLPHPAFFQTGKSKSLAFIGAADALDLIAAPTSDEGEKPSTGYVVLAWTREGDRMSLRQVDHRRVATLIVQGAVPGKVNWQSESTSSTLIGGDPNLVAEIFNRYDFFEQSAPFSLRRVGDDAKALERALKRAGGGQKAKKK